MENAGTIRAGMGGWIFEPWESSFYPAGLPKTRQLEYASRQVPTIEINATYYRGQSPKTFANWAGSAPDDFIYSLKGNRFVTNKKVLAEAGMSLGKFFEQDVAALGAKLGPILWQFAPTKKFAPDDFEGFLELLPPEDSGLPLRHALEVRNESFAVPEFAELAAKYNAAIVYADHFTYPAIADVTSDFVYLRLQKGDDSIPTAYPREELKRWADIALALASGDVPDGLPLAAPYREVEKRPRDVFVYFIHEGKVRAPHAAMSFMELIS
jgi:uncharacterized protein YecE (DUF72 family)